MTIISKEFHFSASHNLLGLAENHPCSNVHGHNYVLVLYLAGNLDERGFVVDYRDLESVKKYVDEELDHKHLNDVFDFNTTVENMSKYIYNLFKPKIPQLYAIELSETPKTRCFYAPEFKGC